DPANARHGSCKGQAVSSRRRCNWSVDSPVGGAQPVAPPPPSAAFDIMAPDSTSPSTVPQVASHTPASKATAGLIVGALGVVFGDIGTSPLYALRESFLHGAGIAPTPDHVLGVLSVLFWAVTLTLT